MVAHNKDAYALAIFKLNITVTTHQTQLKQIYMMIKTLNQSKFRLKQFVLPLSGIYLFTLNLPHTTSIQEAAFFLALLLTLYSSIKRRDWNMPLKLPFALWVGVTVLSVFASTDPYFSIEMIKKEVLYYILSFWLFYTVTENVRDFLTLSYTVFASAVVVIVLSGYYYNWLGIDEVEMGKQGILYGQRAYYSFFILSSALLCLAPLLLKEAKTGVRIFCLILLPLCLPAIYFAKLRATYLSIILIICVVIGAATVASKNNKVRIGLLAFICVILFLSLFFIVDIHLSSDVSLNSLKRYANEERWIIWSHYIKSILAHPVIGTGFGNKSSVLAELGGRALHPHNLFLSYGVMLGIPGMFVLTLLFGSLAKLLFKALSFARNTPGSHYIVPAIGLLLLLSFVVQNITADVMVEHSGEFFWALMGMILGCCKRNKPLKER